MALRGKQMLRMRGDLPRWTLRGRVPRGGWVAELGDAEYPANDAAWGRDKHHRRRTYGRNDATAGDHANRGEHPLNNRSNGNQNELRDVTGGKPAAAPKG